MSNFKLNSEDPDFKSRQKKVFDQLLVLENNRKNVTPCESNKQPPCDRKAQRNETKHFRGKESMFKKPQLPVPRNFMSKIPDFKKNPHKWTKYSLEDVQDVTDESNTKSAMDFLKELADRRKMELGIAEEKLDELPNKIVFNKHVKKSSVKEDETSSDLRGSFNSSKLIMPEYVIGQKPTDKDRTQTKVKPQKGKELRLEHLTFDEDD